MSPAEPAFPGNGPGARLFVALQHVLPQHALSRLVHAATRSRVPWFKDALIDAFVRGFRPDMADAVVQDPHGYESFNAFFTRALRPGTRPLPEEPDELACPVDGTVSEAGRIHDGLLVQAKGRSYTLEALLAGRSDWARRFDGGHFATIYLAPYNYHRIHMAMDGSLRDAWYVPGRLFSVNQATAAGVAGLFARNERVICCFEDRRSEHALVMVGALNVGSMDTVWHGEVAPRARRVVTPLAPRSPGAPIALSRGDEMGRFNMGSTVILLFPPGRVEWRRELRAGRVVRMGEPVGRLLGNGR
ncbi:MAG: archaetidylserine decarboxylase [Steroidobacteraceae bacterium]|jgi:phosphatidylserine decarboxylase|nr:archaetidylserine decarboxylase [Steroidobacteraceae bacterium]